MSKIENVAKDITALIRTADGAECAVLDLVPDLDLSQVRDLQIIVTPQGYSRPNTGAATRAAPDQIVTVNIAVMKKCANESEIPGMLDLVEAVAAAIERQQVSIGIVTAVENDPIYDVTIFRQKKIFLSIMTATVKVLA